jgi:L-ascorbate metabolism protein UlaG (beta-lactamase superfamily)
MFSVTSLGHQGWLIGAGETHVLVDPLLRDDFSRMPLAGARVFPPRRVDLASFPPIAAVLISHEHPDHLDFASLQLLGRTTRVFLSGHSSQAARRVIASLGLRLELMVPGTPLSIGNLVVTPIAPTVVGEPGSNEIDVVAILVRDREGHGSFFSSIDLHCTPAMAREVRRHLDRPGVWVDANSGYDRGIHYAWHARDAHAVQTTADQLGRRYAAMFDGWGHPEAVLITDNGLTLGGDLAELNRHVFEVPNDALIAALRELLPGHVFHAAVPGTTVELDAGRLLAVHAERPFLATLDAERWPSRGGAPLSLEARRNFSPSTGRRSLEPGDEARLEHALGELGRFLFARTTHRGVCQLMPGRDFDPARKATVALALRDGDAAQVWEYVPEESRFSRVTCDAPEEAYVAGACLWATDLLAVLTFEAAADDLFHFGRKWMWNVAHASFTCDLDTEIELFAHALHASTKAEVLYRSSLREHATTPVPAADLEVNKGPSWSHPARLPVVRAVPPAFASIAAIAPSAGNGAGNARGRAAEREVSPAIAEWLVRAVQVGSAGAWRLVEITDESGALRATLATQQGEIALQVTAASDAGRCYRKLGPLAFSYSPGSVESRTLAVLDRVIEAVPAELGHSLRSGRGS